MSLSILMVRQGWRVAIFEKETYPFHRVCGEYVSNESIELVRHLGIDLRDSPKIHRLAISSIKGRVLKAELPLGGFGISRFRLDHQLAQVAIAEGVDLHENCRVDQIRFIDEGEGRFELNSRKGATYSRLVVCAFGKKSNLDVKLDREFTRQKPKAENNYIGVKYHVRHPDFPPDLIELMNFKDGYCGMSMVEDGKYCLCYLTTAASLRKCGNSIRELENKVLKQNPFLAERLEYSERLFEDPLTIANINFLSKSVVEDHLLMVGDAAGSIAPLAGNGMSMSFHAAWLLHGLADKFLRGELKRAVLESTFTDIWTRKFRTRIIAGTRLQRLFGNTHLTELAIGTLKYLPFVTRQLIRLTHGKPFFTPNGP